MQTMLRGAGLAFLLFTSLLFTASGPASAMDQSAMEETNCLMACDANQEHCATGYRPAQRNYSPAETSSSAKLKASSVVRARPTIAGR